jgi:hypothetical protein
MTIEIREFATVRLPNLQRSAIKSLLEAAGPDYTVSSLLELVLVKGLVAVLKGRPLPEVPDITIRLEEQAEASIPVGRIDAKHPRIASDYVGFSITAEQQAALEELEARYPFLGADEMGRILLDCAIRSLPTDDRAQRLLDAASASSKEPR